jgi:hypothetical protein
LEKPVKEHFPQLNIYFSTKPTLDLLVEGYVRNIILASSQVLEASGSVEPSILLIIDEEPTSRRLERRMRSIFSVLSSKRTAANTAKSFRAYKIGK